MSAFSSQFGARLVERSWHAQNFKPVITGRRHLDDTGSTGWVNPLTPTVAIWVQL